jgi:osmoprotectant transport system permease protein
MEFMRAAVAWLADPRHWSGPDGIPVRVLEHIWLSGAALLAAAVIALPAGVVLGHLGRGGFVAINVAAIGRVLPSLAVLAFTFALSLRIGLGFGFWPTFLAMVPLGLAPILTNSYAGVRAVDREIIEAGRGMGMGEWRLLRSVELPLAAELTLAGLRTAAVAIIATATLGAVVAGGGLGRYIVDGFALQEYERMFAGALLVAAVAVVTEIGFGAAQRAARRNIARHT